MVKTNMLDECYERTWYGVYVAAANRIGLEQYLPDTGIEFWEPHAGPSKKFWRKPHTTKKILIAGFRLYKRTYVRTGRFRDRRIDAFGDITKER
jgi:N-carbamoylputrescine amidase